MKLTEFWERKRNDGLSTGCIKFYGKTETGTADAFFQEILEFFDITTADYKSEVLEVLSDGGIHVLCTSNGEKYDGIADFYWYQPRFEIIHENHLTIVFKLEKRRVVVSVESSDIRHHLTDKLIQSVQPF
jgi:hypothetical protein